MCNPILFMVGSMALTAVQGRQQAQAQQAQANYQAKVADQNAGIATQQADQQRKIAAIEGDRQAARVRQVLGRQRVAMAANNLDLNVGTAAAIQEETAGFGASDIDMVVANAAREAWGFDVQATNYRNDASFTRTAGRNAAMGTYLSTGSQIMGTYGNYKGWT